MRTAFPDGGGGPNAPSLSSSDIVNTVSHDCQRRSTSFFCTPNQLGPSASGLCTRIVPSSGGKYSNLAFIDTSGDQAELREPFLEGNAPYEDQSAPLGLAWFGLGWDTKLADFDNDTELEVVLTNRFITGRVNRWPQLHEMASTNDDLISNP